MPFDAALNALESKGILFCLGNLPCGTVPWHGANNAIGERARELKQGVDGVCKVAAACRMIAHPAIVEIT